MGSNSETAALVALLRHGNQPWRRYSERVEEAGGALAVLEEERTAKGRLFEDAGLDQAEHEVAQWRRLGIEPVTVLDSGYPENLRRAHDRPPLIFVVGATLPRDARAVAVVGARAASSRGLAAATAIAQHLVERQFTVVSGLASGIDTAAHTAALRHRGRTIAVLGTGIDRVYPPQNADLQRRIGMECALISQFWPGSPPSRRSFPMRNAVMSGLTLATVVVEASHTSGSRIQARLALAQGRPVFLMQRLLDQPWARELARRPGTRVVREPAEITDLVERISSLDALTG
jgi:DNA processing protein